MSEKIREFIEIPQQFAKEGKQVRSALNLALKSAYGFFGSLLPDAQNHLRPVCGHSERHDGHATEVSFVYAEFISICRAVGIGFAVMGFIGYFVKLIHIPM